MTTANWTCEKVELICVDCGKPNGFYVSAGMDRAIKRRGILPRCKECGAPKNKRKDKAE